MAHKLLNEADYRQIHGMLPTIFPDATFRRPEMIRAGMEKMDTVRPQDLSEKAGVLLQDLLEKNGDAEAYILDNYATIHLMLPEIFRSAISSPEEIITEGLKRLRVIKSDDLPENTGTALETLLKHYKDHKNFCAGQGYPTHITDKRIAEVQNIMQRFGYAEKDGIRTP